MDFSKVDNELLQTMPLPDWSDESNNQSRGALLIVGGSARTPGAVTLAARGALRVGASAVHIAVPSSIAAQIGIALPEATIISLPETPEGAIAPSAHEILLAEAKLCQAVLVGPGLLSDPVNDTLVGDITAGSPLPVVIESSALQAGFKKGAAPQVLLLDSARFEALSDAAIAEDRVQSTSDLATKLGVTAVLKGQFTVIATEDEKPAQSEAETKNLNPIGSGEVLAGSIAGFLAQGLSAHQAAIWAVHINTEASDAAAKDFGEIGLLARDYLDRLPSIQKYLRAKAQVEKRTGFGLRR